MGVDGNASHQSVAAPSVVGRPGRYELLIFNGEDVRTVTLPAEGAVTIGRGKSTVRIDDPSVSRNHAVLHVGAKLVLEDLGSVNGTMVRERPDAGSGGETVNLRQLRGCSAELAVGASLLFGTTSVVVRHPPVLELPDLSPGGPGVIIRDAAMRAIYQQASLAARSLINVLILGETGVGKEVLARAIHAHSRRAAGPFIAINCATLSESLQESELFGCEKGAFTGALQARPGFFEAANGGTLFLDEVGELAASTQAKLLRVLAERQVMRLGSTAPRSVDVRLVAATNRDVEAESQAGRFRQDLFFRLNGMSLEIPPLRERAGEIEPLARIFLAAIAREVERLEPPVLSPEVVRLLQRFPWPGNVRELRNVIERAVVLCPGNTILPEHLPPSLLKGSEAGAGAPPRVRSLDGCGEPTSPLRRSEPLEEAPARRVESLEAARIIAALELHAGNQTRAAQELGISRRTLISRLDLYGIARPRKPL